MSIGGHRGSRRATESPAAPECPNCATALSRETLGDGLCPGCLIDLALESPALLDEAETLVGGASSLAPGSVLGGRYRIRSLLGRGGMGEVWRAFDLKLRVDVALKALRTLLLTHERALETLRQEVRSAREVVSQNVCRVFDLVELDGRELVSMEYVDGTTLRAILDERSPLDLGEAQEIASQFLAGLEAIHSAGLVHRDIKPENVMITRTGRVVVMDFGIAKGAAEAHSGTVSGTPAYMAPEQARGESLDARADVFSAAVMLAEMVAPGGVRSEDARRRLLESAHARPPRLEVTPWRTALERAMAADKVSRPATAAELARALEEVTLRAGAAEDVHPYPGLASFGEEDAEYFFGRELEVEEMWRKLQRPHLLALIAPSGAGKSSFLSAGLLPAAPPGWEVAIATPGDRPFTALAQVLVRQLAGDQEAMEALLDFETADVAVPLFKRWRARHGQALVVVDQFEELFTQSSDDVQERFAEFLSRLALDADVHVLLSMRDDFLFHCQRFAALKPIFSELSPLGALGGSARRRALVQPALKCGYRFEDDRLVEEMVEEVSDEPGALPLLAFAAARLWELRDRERGLLLRGAYDQIGGVGGALARHAEDTLEAIGPDRVPLVRELLRNLVTPDGTRARRHRDELLSLFEGGERGIADEILSELIDARLLTSYDETDTREEESRASRVEIIHESLLTAWPRLVRWQTQDADSAQMREQVRRAAAVWDERGRSEDLLWTGAAYREFTVWKDGYPGRLTEIEDAFAAAVTDLAERRKRRRRVAIAAGFVVLAAGLAVVVGFWRDSIQQARRAEASQLVALGRNALGEDPAEAVAHALASLELSDQRSARRLALEALWRSPTSRRVVTPRADALAFGPRGHWLALGHGPGEAVGAISLVARDGTPGPSVRGHDGAVIHLEFATSEILVSYAQGESVKLWRVPDLQPMRTLALEGPLGFRLAPDAAGRLGIVTWEESGLVKWWPLQDGEPVALGSAPHQKGRFEQDNYWDVDRIHRSFVYARGKQLLAQPLGGIAAGEPELVAVAPDEILTVRVSPDGLMVAANVQKAPARLWRLAPPRGEIGLTAAPGGGYQLYRSLAFSPDSAQLAVGAGSSYYLWSLEDPPDAEPRILHRRGMALALGAAFSPDGRALATVEPNGNDVWSLQGRYARVMRKAGEVWGLGVAPDGSWIAASGPQEARMWPTRRATELSTRPVVEWAPETQRLAVSPDGSRIAVGQATGEIHILGDDGKRIRTIRPFSRSPIALAFAPQGGVLAYAGGERNPEEAFIRVHDLETDEVRDLVPGHGVFITHLAFTGDDRLIESSLDSLGVWNLATGSRRELFRGPVWDGQPGPEGDSVVFLEHTGIFSGVPRRIDIDSGEERPVADWGTVGGLTVTPAGELIGASPEGTVRVGPLVAGAPHLLFGHQGFVMNSTTSGGWVVSGGNPDQTVRIWPMPDVAETPFHLLPYEELLARLRALTNVRVVPDPDSPSGYRSELAEFQGWEAVPAW